MTEQQSAPWHRLGCAYCLKKIARTYSLKRHVKFGPRTSVKSDNTDMVTIMFQMITAEGQYRQKLEKAKMVSTLLNMNKELSDKSLTDENQRALKIYR